MFKLLQSLFGNDKKGSYPEALVTAAIERAVDGTDPWMRAVSGYKKKLRPAVIRSIDHVVELVDRLPSPMPMSLAGYTDNLRLKSFFISAIHMKKVLDGDRTLAEFMKGAGGDMPRVIALMAMEKQERMIFGAALQGDIVIKDVPQVTVNFDAHRFIDPSGDEEETRRYLKRRAFDHLLSLALKRLSTLKGERGDLDRRRQLLQSKLSLLQREGWGFDESDPAGKLGVSDLEKRLQEIESQMAGLGGDDRMFETYLETVVDVLGRPDEYLWSKTETIYVDRMGIKQSAASSDAPELTYSEIHNAEGRSQVMMLVTLQGEELRGG